MKLPSCRQKNGPASSHGGALTGLGDAAPGFANALLPTALELRKRAIHTNYRAVLDILPAGGYGTLYGPNVSNDGVVGRGQGKIAGWEHLAYADDGSGENVTLMVQVPASFDPKRACIVTAPSSGSRGVYGAIGASGEWGLKQGCAVAYTDKGTGNGLHDLTTNTVGLIDGARADAAQRGRDSHFTAAVSDAERAAFNAAHAEPRRLQARALAAQPGEPTGGRTRCRPIRFAFYVLNETFGEDGSNRQQAGGAESEEIRSSLRPGSRTAPPERWPPPSKISAG